MFVYVQQAPLAFMSLVDSSAALCFSNSSLLMPARRSAKLSRKASMRLSR